MGRWLFPSLGNGSPFYGSPQKSLNSVEKEPFESFPDTGHGEFDSPNSALLDKNGAPMVAVAIVCHAFGQLTIRMLECLSPTQNKQRRVLGSARRGHV